ncbi:MAG: aminopeptidase [Thaumarchaeota archaeon]|nr:aminopeptidase [Nitrososphaerota archaeon]
MSPKSRPNTKSTVAELEEQVAVKVVSEALHLKKGESLTVETWNNGLPLARRVVAEARKAGAIPVMLFEDEDTYVFSVKNAPKDAMGKMGKHEYQLLAATDAYFFIPNEVLESYTKRLTPEEVERATSYGESWYEAAEKAKLRGARMSFGFAGKELARMLGKPLEEIMLHQLKATLVDNDSLRKAGRELESRIPGGSGGSLVSGGAHLTFKFEKGVHIEDGVVGKEDVATGHNMAYLPPGFIRRDVNSESVSGRVKLSPSISWAGMIGDATLDFDKGRLVRWSSRSSKKTLDTVIGDQSESERKLRGITVGLNPVMRYGYGQDRFVPGSIGIAGLEFTGIVRSGTLRASRAVIVNKGRLNLPQ